MQQSDEREAVYEAKNYKLGSNKKRRYEKYIIPFELEGIIKPMVKYILTHVNMEIDERQNGGNNIRSPSLRRQYSKDPNKQKSFINTTISPPPERDDNSEGGPALNDNSFLQHKKSTIERKSTILGQSQIEKQSSQSKQSPNRWGSVYSKINKSYNEDIKAPVLNKTIDHDEEEPEGRQEKSFGDSKLNQITESEVTEDRDDDAIVLQLNDPRIAVMDKRDIKEIEMKYFKNVILEDTLLFGGSMGVSPGGIMAFSLSPNGRLIAIAITNGSILVYDTENFQLIRIFEGEQFTQFGHLEFSGDNSSQLLALSDGGFLSIFLLKGYVAP